MSRKEANTARLHQGRERFWNRVSSDKEMVLTSQKKPDRQDIRSELSRIHPEKLQSKLFSAGWRQRQELFSLYTLVVVKDQRLSDFTGSEGI